MDQKEMRKYVASGKTNVKPETSLAQNPNKHKLDLSKAKGLIGLDRRASVPLEVTFGRRDSGSMDGSQRRDSISSEEPGTPPSPSSWMGSPPPHLFTQQSLLMTQAKQQKPMIFKQFDFK